ncbi:MAG TPA: glycosyltransferase family A protein [Novosphingobium sp.]|nr:glycosyltransferase family A protein [Novosphingobium sp.]
MSETHIDRGGYDPARDLAYASGVDVPGATARTSLPRISVIVPAYGVAALLPDALRSLQAQTMSDWECIVIDDGAPDDVAGAVGPFLSDSRVTFVQTGNHGVSAARNAAIAASHAPLVALLDGDDLFRPDYLARVVDLLEGDRDVRIATSNARIFGAVERESLVVTARQGTGDGIRADLSDVLDRSFNIYIGSAFRRADFDAVGGFDESMTHAEDFDLWVRLMMLGGPEASHAAYIDAVLGEYRVRLGSASAHGARMLRGNIRVYEKALTALPESKAARTAQRMLDENRDALAFEEAIERLIDGDSGALPQLREAAAHSRRPIWSLAVALWSLCPPLASPMLRWRRHAHKRGGIDTLVPPLGAGVGAATEAA